MKLTIRLATLALWVLFVSLPALSREIVLFQNGEAAKEYSSLVRSAEAGDILQFSDNVRFKIVQVLGSGTSEVIFALDDKTAIRVRLAFIPAYPERDIYLGWPELKENGVAIAEFHERQPNPLEYILVKRYEGESLLDFLESRYRYTQKEIDHRFDKLVEFAATTASFEYIDDFFPKNIFWEGKRWILIDWDSTHDLAQGKKNAFTSWQNPSRLWGNWPKLIPQKIYDRINQAIDQERTLKCKATFL